MLSDTSLGHQPQLAEKLHALNLPLLYLCGERDSKFRAIAEANHFPLRTIQYAGHNTHQANPAAFAETVRTFYHYILFKELTAMMYPSEEKLSATVEWVDCTGDYQDILFHKSKTVSPKSPLTVRRCATRSVR